MDTPINNKDSLISFSFKNALVRGKIARLSKCLIPIKHRYKSHKSVDKIILDCLALSVVVANDFKIESDFKLQIESTNGIIQTLICDTNQAGDVRVFLSLDKEKLSKYSLIEEISFAEVVGTDTQCTLFADYNLKKIYRDILPLNENTIEENMLLWFEMSQQIRSYVSIKSDVDNFETSIIFLQIIPDVYANEEQTDKNIDDFNTLVSHSNTVTHYEAFNDNYADLVHKLYHEFDPVIYALSNLQFKCKCSLEKMKSVISVMPEEEQEELRKERNGDIEIICDFCGTVYHV